MIGVIVPVYNMDKYLRRCVDSILNQSLNNYETILVDDGSTDQSGMICDEYASKESRVHVIHQDNKGLSAARNAGIEYALNHCSINWITFIDSDDWIHPQYLEFLFEAANSQNAAISACYYEEAVDYKFPEHIDSAEIGSLSPEDFWLRDHITATVAWGKLYAKDLFKATRYPVGMIREDEFVTYKLLFSLKDLPLVHYPLYYYYQNSNGIMRSKWTTDHLVVLDAYLMQIEFFHQNGYIKAYEDQSKRFVRACGHSLDRIEKNVDDPDEKAMLQKKLLKTLRQFVKNNRASLSFRSNPRGLIYSLPGFFFLINFFKKRLMR